MHDEKPIFCSFRGCKHKDCINHYFNIPFNLLVIVDSDLNKTDKKGNCKNYST